MVRSFGAMVRLKRCLARLRQLLACQSLFWCGSIRKKACRSLCAPAGCLILVVDFALYFIWLDDLVVFDLDLADFIVLHEFENAIIEVCADFFEEDSFILCMFGQGEIDAESVAICRQIGAYSFFK